MAKARSRVIFKSAKTIRVDSVGRTEKDGSLLLNQTIHEPGKRASDAILAPSRNRTEPLRRNADRCGRPGPRRRSGRSASASAITARTISTSNSG